MKAFNIPHIHSREYVDTGIHKLTGILIPPHMTAVFWIRVSQIIQKQNLRPSLKSTVQVKFIHRTGRRKQFKSSEQIRHGVGNACGYASHKHIFPSRFQGLRLPEHSLCFSYPFSITEKNLQPSSFSL